MFWDRDGRLLSATQIVTSTSNTSQPDPGFIRRWILTTRSPHITVTVAAHEPTPGVLALLITPARAADVRAPAAPDEHFFGLGERFGGLDLSGQAVENWTQDQTLAQGRSTSYAPAPFLLSSRGYGLLLDTTAHATFDLRTTQRGCYHIRVDAPQLSLALIAGPHPQAVIERHAHLVGLPPRWAFGVWKT
jgi:alpha-D-xyloside xylohydrolase